LIPSRVKVKLLMLPQNQPAARLSNCHFVLPRLTSSRRFEYHALLLCGVFLRMAWTNRRTGVVLFQLGGPDSIEAIEPFLYNLFSDPDIIDFPLAKIARKPLAKLISSNRARKVQSHYAEIGGKSPILEYTTAQACALEGELN